MVVSARSDGATSSGAAPMGAPPGLNMSARVRKTIQSLKEIVGNHSEADIYAALKESNMDPNETAQKLLNQDPFHEVRRRRDKKKEVVSFKSSGMPRRPPEPVQPAKSHTFPDRGVRRGGFVRNAPPGISREFRVVRDNRINQNTNRDIKSASVQSSFTNVEVITSIPAKSPKENLIIQDSLAGRNTEDHKPSQVVNRSFRSNPRLVHDADSGAHNKGLYEDTLEKVPNSGSFALGLKPRNSQPSAILASSNSEVGLYSSSSDPVHVPSPDSRASGAVGAIKREVGVVGVRRQLSENSAKHSSFPSSSLPSSLSFADSNQQAPAAKITQPAQVTLSESALPDVSTSRPFSGNQYTSKVHQVSGHQKATQPNMEWKPKSSQKMSAATAAQVGTSANLSPPGNRVDTKMEADHLQERLSGLSVSENQHVIIPLHLQVPEADRTWLTFGSFDVEFDPSKSLASRIQGHGLAEQSTGESSASVSAPLTSIDDGIEVEMLHGQLGTSGSVSPVSEAASDYPSHDKKDSSSPRNLENYVDVGLVRNDTPSYTSVEPQQQLQDVTGLPSFAAYDPQTAYDMPFLNPMMEESARGHGLPSLQEVVSSSISNSIPVSTAAMLQQPPMAHMYPQMHVSPFPIVPYRQYLSHVYVPPMAVPGYSNGPAAYPHPSNGNSYVLMPGGSSHLAPGSLKYGASQYKPVPSGTATGFGSYSNLPGYAMNTQGAVGGASGLEDSTRMKYKEGNIFVPNAQSPQFQADASELWIQAPREIPGLQSTPFYNVAGQTPHAAYMPNHTGHASFNVVAAAAAAAAAAGQPSPMQYPLYHPSPQPAAIANHPHMVPAMGGNVGVGVGVAAAAPGAQVGAYQQPQLGHMNWNTNF